MNTTTTTTTPRTLVWDLPTRVFHWLLVLSFAGAYLSSEGERWAGLHTLLGYTAGGLIVFRLLWGVVGTVHARFTSFPLRPTAVLAYLKSIVSLRPQHFTGHNPAGSWAVVALLLLVIATALSGWMNYADQGPAWVGKIHEGLANATVALVVIHIAAVLISSLLHRENLVRAMVVGYKRGAGPAAAGSRIGVAVVLVAVVAAFWGGYVKAPGLEVQQSLTQAYSAGAGARHHGGQARDDD